MPSPRPSRALQWFALLTAFCTLLLIGLGGLVTSHEAGMSVPDWPNSYGYNMFAFPISQWVGNVLYEHSHRLVATLVGTLTAVLAIWLWARETSGKTRWLGVGGVVGAVVLLGVRQMPVYLILASASLVLMVAGLVLSHRSRWSLRWLGMVAFGAVVLQGVLGGLRVVWKADELGIFHATLAQLFLVLLSIITWCVWRERAGGRSRREEALTPSMPVGNVRDSLPSPPPTGLHRVLVTVTLLVLAQLILGATMRHQHAGLAIPDFPLAYGRVWPDMSTDAVARYNQQRMNLVAQNPITATQIALQMTHRIMALLIVAGVVFSFVLVRRRTEPGDALRKLSGLWLLLICAQFGLGAWTIWSNKAADVASLHVVGGALSLVTGSLICVLSASSRRATAVETAPAPVESTHSPGLPGHQEALAAK